jgi:hypothetical protein
MEETHDYYATETPILDTLIGGQEVPAVSGRVTDDPRPAGGPAASEGTDLGGPLPRRAAPYGRTLAAGGALYVVLIVALTSVGALRQLDVPLFNSDQSTATSRSLMMSVPSPVRRALTAVENLDTSAFVDAFATRGEVDDWGRVFRGRDEIEQWSNAEFIGQRVTLDLTDVQVRDAEVTVEAIVGGDGFNGPSAFTFTVGDGELTGMRITG